MKSDRKDFKLAFNSNAYCGPTVARDIEEVVQALARSGLDAVELNAEDNWGPLNRHAGLDIDADQIARTRRACQQQGLSVSSIGAHFSLVATDQVEREKAIREYQACIDQALQVDTDFVHGFAGIPSPLLLTDEERGWQLLASGCCQVLDYAAERGVRFGIEPVIHHLVHGYDSIVKMFDLIDRDDLWLNYDPVHIYISGNYEDCLRVIRRFGDRIAYVHIHDGIGQGSFSWANFKRDHIIDWNRFTPPFMGEIDWRAIVAELKQIGYTGYLSYEYPVGYEPSYKFYIDYAAKHYVRLMCELLSQI